MLESVIFHPEFDPAEVISSIRQHGVALLKNVLPRDQMMAVTDPVKRHYDLIDEQATSGQMDPAFRDWILLNGLAAPNLPDTLKTIVDIVAGTRIGDCARTYFNNGDLALADNHFLFRVRNERTDKMAMEKGTRHLFHQDHDLVDLSFPMNVWIPLTKIDAECTGLTFVFPYTTEIFPLPFDIERYLMKNNGSLWTPELDIGDALLFHHCTIHGSFIDGSNRASRYSAEFRIGLRENVPASYAEFLRPLKL